jgi:hypothetical protein
MKTNLSTGSRSLSKLHAAIMAATLAVSGLATVAHGAAFDSPTGLTWDCVISGARNGLAYLTFDPSGTITGVEILVPRRKPSSSDSDGRGGFEPDDRNPSGTSGGTTNQVDQIFGPADINGLWSFDTSGKVVGFFAEGTNSPLGFRASVSQGSRITMVASISAGKTTYSGRPAVLLVGSYGGAWNGFKNQNNQSFVEIFNMSLVGGQGPNLYNVSGNGGGYSYTGIAIISVQKKIAFGLDITPSTNLRATFGSFDLGKAKGSTKGWDQLPGPVGSPAKFKVEQQPPP